jgi:hypothetical protein
MKRYTHDDFLKESKKYHGNKYDYSISEYIKASLKVKIICPIHGEFEQFPSDHVKGHGCNKCAIESKDILKKKDYNIFLSELFRVHGDKYDLSKVIYRGASKKVTLICPIHGEFESEANSLLKGHGCNRCSADKKALVSIEKSKTIFFQKTHKFKIIPSSYTKATGPCLGICSIHGIFKINKAYTISQGTASCPSCRTSNQETEIYSYVKELNKNSIQSFRPEWLEGKELDIYVPEFNFAIEFNGSYWHSENHKDKWYHFDKTKSCKDNGVILLHIWEHYWNDPIKQEIYKSKIRHFLKMDNRIYARKTHIKPIDKSFAIDFVKQNHLEGFGIPYRNSKYIGLFKDEQLLMVAIYGEFYQQSKKSFEWKLQRIATLKDFTVVGGVSKLSKYIKNDIGEFIFQITLDTGGSLVSKELFRKDVSLRYWWLKGNKFLSRNQTQVLILKQNLDWHDYDTEVSYMKRNGYLKVWDSGIIEIVI